MNDWNNGKDTRKKEKKKRRSLIKRLMGGVPEKNCVEHDRVLPDVNFESWRGLVTNGLNYWKINSSFSKGSSTAWPDWVAGIVTGEEITKAWEEPMLSRNSALGSEPKLRVEREKSISWLKVTQEGLIRGSVGVLNLWMRMVLPSKVWSPLWEGKKKENWSGRRWTGWWRESLW